MVLLFKNHLTGECLNTYKYHSTPDKWSVNTVKCYDTVTSQQWVWSGLLLKSVDLSQCLSVSYSSSGFFLFLTGCDSSNQYMYWQENNNTIASGYYDNYCVTSDWGSGVYLDYCGNNYFQYWDYGNKTATVYPNIISFQNHLTGECLNAYKYHSTPDKWRVNTIKCDDTIMEQKWAWFGNLLQSIDLTWCLTATTSSSPYLSNCNPSNTYLYWQYDNNEVRSKYYDGYCLTTDYDSNAFLASCDGNNERQDWYGTNDTFTFSPTMKPTLNPTINPTTDPTTSPTISPTSTTLNPTAHPTLTPTLAPTFDPTLKPTSNPTVNPTLDPTSDPTVNPTLFPTFDPTLNPTTNKHSSSSSDDSWVIPVSVVSSIIGVCVIGGLAWYGWNLYQKKQSVTSDMLLEDVVN